MLFSPGKGLLLLTLYNEGEFAVWDVAHGLRVSVSSYLLGRSLKALDLDWISQQSPIVGKAYERANKRNRTSPPSCKPFHILSFLLSFSCL